MSTRTTSAVVATIAGLAFVVAGAGAAVAISGGEYGEHKQGCANNADANNREDGRQPAGCHDSQLLIRDGRGHTYVQAGTNTTREGTNVHSADAMVSPDGSGSPQGRAHGTAVRAAIDTHYQPIPKGECGLFDLITYPIGLLTGGACDLDPSKLRMPSKLPTMTHDVTVGKHLAVTPKASGLILYFGADDGLDTGEHDEPDGKHGTSKDATGPSDGGAVEVRLHPNAVNSWVPLVVAGVNKANPAAIATDPVPILDAGAGACADGICLSGQSHRRVAWRGGGRAGKHRDAYDYTGKHWDPYDCSGESSAAEQKCHDKHHKSEDEYYKDEAKSVDVEPGLQIYEDPDPSGSPLAPTYPLPALYAGTCGVTVGGGPAKLPASPLTNRAGQLAVKPSHC